MLTWPQFTARFTAPPDLLGFAPCATPAADEWLAAFTDDFMRYPDAAHGAQALMSGLRFYTAAFVAEIAALPPVGSRRPALVGAIPREIYTATGPIIAGVYAQFISRDAPPPQTQAAFARETPALVACYQASRH
jgi:hypothetical protein